MFKFCFYVLPILIGLSGGFAADVQGNVLWQETFLSALQEKSTWRWYDISAEAVDGCLRVRESGEKSWGSFQKYIDFDLRPGSEYRYLQVFAGAVEFTEMGGTLTNTSSGGGLIGPVFPGWNTYDLYGQPGLAGKSGKFSLAFIHSGKQGLEPGGWADYKLFRMAKKPYNGLSVQLFRNGSEIPGPARVGDVLQISCYTENPLPEKELALSCMAFPMKAEYRFSVENLILREREPGLYRCEVPVTAEAIALDSEADKQHLVFCARIQGEFTYGTLASALKIEGNGRFAYDQQIKGTPQTIEYRKLWLEASKGNNLATGKKVIFSRTPDYPLTQKGNTDHLDLTDGKLSQNEQDKIWFDQHAVGWLNGAADGVNLLLDLGEIKNVDRVVLRCMGGAGGNLSFPARLQLFLSTDGKIFYQTANLEKLMIGERSQSDFRNYFYLPEENSSAYVYPFTLNANAKARYIGLRLYGTSHFLFCDEMAVLEAESPGLAELDLAGNQEPQPFYTSGIVFGPRINRLPVASNAILPNHFFIQDMRTDAEIQGSVKLWLELPRDVELLNSLSAKTQNSKTKYLLQEQKNGRLKSETGSFFIRCSPDAAAVIKAGGAEAIFYAEAEGLEPILRSVPLSIVELPALPVFRRLHVSLSWMVEKAAFQWPDFYANWRKLGFNAISLFPRYWGASGPDARMQEWLRQGQELGFKRIMNESPFHPMVKGQTPGSEVFSQLSDGKGKNLCPSYRGPLYQKEMQRVRHNVLQSRPDYVFWDAECWYHGAAEAAACSRCSEAWKKSSLNLDDFLKTLGKELNQDLYDHVTAAAEEGGFPMPLVASYDRHASTPNYALVENFFADYPKTLKLAQPSLYVGGRAEDVHDAIRAEYRLLKNRDILPWLSPGCYGEFEPEKMEPMVLEALMNGSSGITYFSYGEFDNALDYYYHASALAKIAPYEDLLLDGEVLEPTGSNPDLYYSGIRKGQQVLILAGNYRRATESTTLQSPLQNVRRIVDVESGQELSGLAFEVPKGGFRLFLLEGTP